MQRLIAHLIQKTGFFQCHHLLLREFSVCTRLITLSILCTFLSAILEGFGIGFILSFLQNLTTPGAVPIHTGMVWIDDWVLGIKAVPNERLYRIAALILLTTWLRSLFAYLSYVFTGWAQAKISSRIRQRLFEQLQAVRLDFFSQTKSGELQNSLTTDVYKLTLAIGAIAGFITSLTALFVYLGILIVLSWQLSLVAMMCFTLLFVNVSKLLRQIKTHSFARVRSDEHVAAFVSEFLQAARTIRASATAEFELNRFGTVNQQAKFTEMQVAKWKYLVDPLSMALGSTILIGILVFAFTVFVQSNQMQPSALLTFLFVLLQLIPRVRQINGARALFRDLQGNFTKIEKLLRTEDKPYLSNGTQVFHRLTQDIQFANVDFGYSRDCLVLKQLSFTIPRGKTTALVGASGAGKSTIADLLQRLYDPMNGEILINQKDLREFDIDTVRCQMGIVSQDPFIFNATVWENIAYGIVEPNLADVKQAAQLAHATEFILQLPEGFNTLLGDRGVRLSGGQRQRLSIARALMRNPQILILDEATSALDSISEQLIQAALENLSSNRTVLIIAHRLSTITKADNIIVLEQGQVLEQGTYAVLLAKQGAFWKLHDMQNDSAYPLSKL